jgi:hypothetical protein
VKNFSVFSVPPWCDAASGNSRRYTGTATDGRGFPDVPRRSSFILHPSSFPRRGISLIEILISLFIILFGLLGVAALLPVGRYDIMVAAKADRGAACARAAMRDIVVRGMVNPLDSQGYQNWNRNDLPSPPTLATLTSAPVAIDPIGVGQGLPLGFPASTLNGIQMYRINLGTGLYQGNQPVPMPLADALRVFRWRDDLQFDVPAEKTERPQQFFRLQDGTQSSGFAQATALNPIATADPEGAYSWLATVSPSPDPTQCTVSVVVFWNRSLTLDRELACAVEGFALGSGDVVLYVPVSGVPPGYDSAGVRDKLMALKQGDWVLFRGVKLPPVVPAPVYAFKWYRVAALGDFTAVGTTPATGTPCNGYRLATLAGPDWDISFTPEVGLFDNVVGVYTETVQVGR